MEVAGKLQEDTTSQGRGDREAEGDMAEHSDSHTCQPCSRTGETVSATAYCRQCQEYICQTCLKSHLMNKASMNHTLLQGADMPSRRPRDEQQDDHAYEICHVHSGLNSAVKFYCRAHDQVCCGDCLVQDHNDCKIEYISDVAKEVSAKRAVEVLHSNLQAVSETFGECEESVPEILQSNSVTGTEAMKDMNTFHTELVALIDQQKQNLKDKFTKNEEEDAEAMNEITGKCKAAKSEIDGMVKQLDSAKGEDTRLFTIAKRRQKDLQTLQKSARQVTSACQARKRNYAFRREPVLVQLLTSQTSLGKLEPETTSCTTLHTAADIASAKLEAAENIIISMEGDEKNSVSGMAHLTPSTLVLVDYDPTNRVTVLDTNTNTIQARLTLSSGPWDVVALTSTEVAVTLPDETAIQILAVHYGKLSKVRRFKVSGHCVGIDCYKNNLVVSYAYPGKVEIIDTQGHVQKVFEYKDDLPDSGRVFSDRPCYAIFTRNGEALLVSDSDNHTITKLCTLGHVLQVYNCKPNRLTHPRAMCVCADSSVLVCGIGSHNIQLLSRDGDFICEILGKEDGLEFPASLALSGGGNMLYVSCFEKNYIQTFRIKYA